MVDNYYIFVSKIENFIDRYYRNRVTRGLLLFLFVSLFLLLTFSIIEYIGWFDSRVRFVLFFTYFFSILFVFFLYILVPILRFFGIFKRITYRFSIRIINRSFPQISDLLVNIYELNYLNETVPDNNLVRASLNQKIGHIRNYRFDRSISNKNLKPLWLYLTILFSIYSFIFYTSPEVFTKGSNRIIHFNNYFERDYGFEVIIDENELIVERGSIKDVNILLVGDVLPSELFILISGQRFLLNKRTPNHYTYTFKNISQSFNFKIVNDFYQSKNYFIELIRTPVLKEISIKLNYPTYTNKQNEYAIDNSNLHVPLGTKLEFTIHVMDCDSLFLMVEDSVFPFLNDSKFSITHPCFFNSEFSLLAKNAKSTIKFHENSRISIISDLFPTISINSIKDLQNSNYYLFNGFINDDYGFSKLSFTQIINNQESTTEIFVRKNVSNQEFYFPYDFSEIEDRRIDYFFTVYDNDAINGFKSTRSDMFYITKPTFREIADSSRNMQTKMERRLEQSILKIDELLRDVSLLKKKLINENLTNYEKSELVNSIQKKQKSLNDVLEQLKKDNSSRNQILNNFTDFEEKLLKKQHAIDNLLENVMDEDIKKLLDELSKLQENFKDNDFNNLSDNLERNYKELEKQLDKNLDLLKQLNVEQNLEIVKDKLFDLSKNQFELAHDFLNNLSLDSLNNKQQQDRENLNAISELFKDVLSKNEDLDKPLSLNNLSDSLIDLNRSFHDTLPNDASNIEKSSKVEKNAKKAKELAQEIESLMSKSSAQQEAENAESLRQILENLLYFSFTQESITEEMITIPASSPNFSKLLSNQFSLMQHFKIISDSLYAVSKRTPYLGTHISNKVFFIVDKLISIEVLLKSDNINKGILDQRLVLENANDLILLLSESLKNMESNFGGTGSSPKKSKKNKPNKGKPSLSDMRKSQESAKNQLEKLVNDLKNGQQPGGKNSSQQLGKLLAQQEIFQQILNQLRKSENIGSSSMNKLNELNKLIEDNKRDIARFKITPQLVNRQNQILTRMLEIEKSENEREIDDKRKSNEALNYNSSNIKLKFEAEQEFTNFDDVYSKSNVQLKYFYKNKYQDYIIKLKRIPNEKGD